MITTIQLHEDVKNQLDKMKAPGKKTYEEVILELISIAEKNKRSQKGLLAEGYKEMAKESLRLAKEWSSADKDWE
jgi:predicted CopG family antitoxin